MIRFSPARLGERQFSAFVSVSVSACLAVSLSLRESFLYLALSVFESLCVFLCHSLFVFFLVKVKDHRGEQVNMRAEHRHGPAIFQNNDDCFYYHFWRNIVVIAFLLSFLTYLHIVSGVECPFASDEKVKNILSI